MTKTTRKPLCACGCGQPINARPYWDNRQKRQRVPRYRVHHQPVKLTRAERIHAGHANHASDVDAASIQALIRRRHPDEREARRVLRETFGIHHAQARRWLTQPKYRRATAERLLAWLADQPRQPSIVDRRRAERQLTQAAGRGSLDAEPIREIIRAHIQRPGIDDPIAQLARAAHVTDRTIHRILTGQPTVSVDVADRVSLALGHNLDALYREQLAS